MTSKVPFSFKSVIPFLTTSLDLGRFIINRTGLDWSYMCVIMLRTMTFQYSSGSPTRVRLHYEGEFVICNGRI